MGASSRPVEGGELDRALRDMGARIRSEPVPDVLPAAWERARAGRGGWRREAGLLLALGALALGIGWLPLGSTPGPGTGAALEEVYRLALGLGALGLGGVLVAVGIRWLAGRGACRQPQGRVACWIGRLAGGISLAAFGLSLLSRGIGLVAYEIGSLALRARLSPVWNALQLRRFLTGVPTPLVWIAALTGAVGLAAFAVQWAAAGVSLFRHGKRGLGLGALALAAAWFTVVAPAYRSRLPHAALLLTGLGALGLGTGWFILDNAGIRRLREAGARYRPVSRLRTLRTLRPLRALQAWAALAGLALVLAACQAGAPASAGQKPRFPAGSYMAEIQQRGTIVIGVKFDIPRFAFLNPATNKPEGFEVALGELIAQRLGVRAEFVRAVSKDRIPLLQKQKADIVISDMTVNEERLQQIDFSSIYYVAHQRLLVRKGSPIRDVGMLEAQKAPVCSVGSSTSAHNIALVAPHAPITLVDTYSECFGLLENGKVQAMSTDDSILTALLSRDPEHLAIVGDPFSVEPYGIGVHKGHPELVGFLNQWIRQAKQVIDLLRQLAMLDDSAPFADAASALERGVVGYSSV